MVPAPGWVVASSMVSLPVMIGIGFELPAPTMMVTGPPGAMLNTMRSAPGELFAALIAARNVQVAEQFAGVSGRRDRPRGSGHQRRQHQAHESWIPAAAASCRRQERKGMRLPAGAMR